MWLHHELHALHREGFECVLFRLDTGPRVFVFVRMVCAQAHAWYCVEAVETAAEKRVRLAKAYLNKIEDSLEGKKNKRNRHSLLILSIDGDGFDAADLDRDLIAERLKKDDVSHDQLQIVWIANSLSI